jgi:phosphotransferase system enzyme I (PtsP)
MFSMVSEVAEFDKARGFVDRELALAQGRDITLPKALHVGAMLEVPSLYCQLPALLECGDFFSVGSNDLLQFLFASDRGNQQVGETLRHFVTGVAAPAAPAVRCRAGVR